MPVFMLTDDLIFPDPEEAEEDGLLCIGGDLNEDRLLLAYQEGIFPWFNAGEPILWWSPDPRCVLTIGEERISKSMGKVLDRNTFKITADTDFEGVITRCALTERRKGGSGTWISAEMQEVYSRLHYLGVAHSFEAWKDNELVGGLYGISLGRAFFGESMFSTQTNASKAAFFSMVRYLKEKGFMMVDGQIVNDHLLSLGFQPVQRKKFLHQLNDSLQFPTNIGSWKSDFNNYRNQP